LRGEGFVSIKFFHENKKNEVYVEVINGTPSKGPFYAGPCDIVQSIAGKLRFGEDVSSITNRRAIEILKNIKSESNLKSFFRKPVVVLALGALIAAATVLLVASLGQVLYMAGASYSVFTTIALSSSMMIAFIIGVISSTKYFVQAMGDVTSGQLARSSEEWKCLALQADRCIRLLEDKNLDEMCHFSDLRTS
jgi:hypothetical protein